MEPDRSHFKIIKTLFWCILVFSITFLITRLVKENSVAAQVDISGKIPAPELTGGLGWLNVDHPVRLADVRGKIVLIDFWTYCCINCMHVIPDLKELEAKYPNELVVVGVHSAKFLNEKETDNIRQAVLRYEIEHPVVNDADFKIWKKYGARSWPTLVLIDPEGMIVGMLPGEGNFSVLDQAIQQLKQKFKGRLNLKPIPLSLEKDKQPPTLLSFPGKVLADEESNRLFIADSNHNRIVMTDLNGKILDIAGSGKRGTRDGAYERAEFNHPQGMVRVNDFLYVADTENHLIRKLHLSKKTVNTVAGVGSQANWGERGGRPLRSALNSPWDLAVLKNDSAIYIAMAGPHQLWVYHPQKTLVIPYAGSGREGIGDGTLQHSMLAQPSGLTTDGQNLYFADSEVSALRWIDRTGKKETVRTLIGKGLFDFGDRDGAFQKALLQHPLGVHYHDKKVYLADTYNHKIKVADLETHTIQTLAGNGKPGVGSPVNPQFNEPGGLSLAHNKLYIADTNNHAIKVIDLSNNAVDTLQLDITSWNQKHRSTTWEVYGTPERLSLSNTNQFIPSDGTITLQFNLPSNHHFNPFVQPVVQCKTISGRRETVYPKFHPDVKENTLQFKINTNSSQSGDAMEIAVLFYYCMDNNQGQCRIGSLLIDGQIKNGYTPLKLTHSVH